MEKVPDSAEELAGKLHELLTESDNETAQFCFREEMIEEVMQELYREISFSTVPVPFHPNPNPYPPLSPSHSSNTLSISPVFIHNGENGSCGAFVSDSASTVMAGIEVLGSSGGFPGTENGSSVVEAEDVGSADALVGEEKKMEVCDGGDLLDEEWLGRVLNWGQQGQGQGQGQVVEWF